MPKTRRTGDWAKVQDILMRSPQIVDKAMGKALKKEGQFLAGEIRKGITSQAPGGKRFKKLSPMTIAMRRLFGFRGTKALVRSGDLRNSITVMVDGTKRKRVFVGVNRTARTSGGLPLANVARIHEFGTRPYVIEMTPKMQALLGLATKYLPTERGRDPKTGKFKSRVARRALSGGTGFIVIQIPPRPFIGPIFEKYAKDAGQVSGRIMARFAEEAGGVFGTPTQRPPK